MFVDTQGVDQIIFDKETDKYNYYNNTGPFVFHLEPKEYNNTIKITLKPVNGLTTIGFSSVDVSLIDYFNRPQTITMPIENLPDSNLISTINLSGISVDFTIDGAPRDNYRAFFTGDQGGLSLVDDNDIEVYGGLNVIRDEQLLNGISATVADGLNLKITMNESNMTSPMFRGCTITYTT